MADKSMWQNFPTTLISGKVVGPGPISEVERAIAREREEWLRGRLAR